MFFKKKQKDSNGQLENQKPKVGQVLPLSDEEPTEKFRLWWSENGKSIITGISLGVVGIIAFQFWQNYKLTQAMESSAAFADVVTAYESGDYERVKATSNALVNDFSSTDYAAQALNLMALSHLDNAQVDDAIVVLESALASAKNPAITHLSRLNLAKAYIEKGNYQLALTTLTTENTDGYTKQYEELKGDVYYSLGEFVKAKSAYQNVLNVLEASDPYREVIAVKINDI